MSRPACGGAQQGGDKRAKGRDVGLEGLRDTEKKTEGAVTQLRPSKLLSFIIYSLRMWSNLEAAPFSSGVLQKGETQA